MKVPRGRALVFLGAPGAGKGTQSVEVARRLGVPHISTGAILRENVQKATDLGKVAKAFIEKGDLVPDDLMNALVRERLRQPDCSRGFLLDGYPRTVAQAIAFDQLLAQLGQEPPVVVNLKVGYDAIVQRLNGRRTCPVCQRTYNLRLQPPLHDNACDDDGATLVERSDDREEAVRERISAYERQTAPLVDYYKGLGRLVQVDGERSPATVSGELTQLLTTV